MTAFRLWLSLWAVLVFTTVSSSVEASGAPASFAPLVEKLTPAVVNISTTQKVKRGAGATLKMPGASPEQQEQFKEFFEQFGGMGGELGQPREQEVNSLGSGFVIDPKGYVVTNNHVIADAEEITVTFHDDTKLAATLVGRDPKTDLALLKVESKEPLIYVDFGDSDKVRVGDWVIAIGNPFGLGGTVSAGIISARSRNINAGPFDDFLQTDAAINRGNSGGPMFNLRGEVIGINTAIFSPTGGNVGIGFSVPATLAEPVLTQLKEFGRTHRGWLGVKIQHVTDEVAESVGLATPSGALVLGVNPEGPAKRAGVKVGDILLSFDGKAVKEMRFLPRIVAETKIGKSVNVMVWREGKEVALNVTLGELDETSDVAAKDDNTKKKDAETNEGEALFGMTLKKLDKSLRDRLKLDESIEGGVVVLSVDRSSDAAKRGVKSGDIIIGVKQQPITSVSELKEAFTTAKSSGHKFALVRLWRNGDATFVTLPTGE